MSSERKREGRSGRGRNMHATLCHYYDIIRVCDVMGHMTIWLPIWHFPIGCQYQTTCWVLWFPRYLASKTDTHIQTVVSTDNGECFFVNSCLALSLIMYDSESLLLVNCMLLVLSVSGLVAAAATWANCWAGEDREASSDAVSHAH